MIVIENISDCTRRIQAKREHWLGYVSVQKLAQSDFFELINKIYTVMEGKYNYSQFLTDKKFTNLVFNAKEVFLFRESLSA